MPYCTLAQLTTEFSAQELVQLTDTQGNSAIDSDVIDALIADTDAKIDSYLRTRYPLPLVNTPPEIQVIACDMVRYRLYKNSMIDTVKDRYEQAIDWLKQVSAGKVEIDSVYVSTPVTSTNLLGATVSSSTAVFSDSLLSKMA